MGNLLLAFYGDDFTGSTDAMEALYKKGYRTVLYLTPPSKEILEKNPELQCIGVAGTGRAKDIQGLEEEIKPIIQNLSNSGARIVHYKTCSTFDSSPEIGSIGCAIKTSMQYFDEQDHVPVIVGAPPLGRYTYFGHHFAKSGDKVYRLDRHPIMSRHPSTPMNESDLGIHLGKQLEGDYGYFNVLLNNNEHDYKKNYFSVASVSTVVIHDIIDNEMLCRSADIIWNYREGKATFVVGSSGIEYGLTDYWSKDANILPNGNIEFDHEAKKQMLVISGSASDVTRQQILDAGDKGYHLIRIPNEIITGLEMESFIDEILVLIEKGDDIVLYTALGPEDENITVLKNFFNSKSMTNAQTAEHIGKCLGILTKEILDRSKLERLIVAGGDTSGFVAKALGIDSLEVIQSISPGAPLCIGKSFQDNSSSIEIALKGGQFGQIDYFQRVKQSTSRKGITQICNQK